ncbi:MAG: hypothetical protein ACLUI6_05875 [Butyricicoccus sp.]
MVHDPISVLDALMIALSDRYCIFDAGTSLGCHRCYFGDGRARKHTAHPVSVSAAAWRLRLRAAAPAPVPQVKLEGVGGGGGLRYGYRQPRTGIPLDQLVFKSIKAV